MPQTPFSSPKGDMHITEGDGKRYKQVYLQP